MNIKTIGHRIVKITLLVGTLTAAIATSALTIPNVPLSVQPAVKPMVMLAASKDHRLFYEAYNDASDVDGDGTLDIRFKPSIIYLGLFSSDYCYKHNNIGDNNGLFEPDSNAIGALKTCPSKLWSGNWLNYVTTSRIDALRVVLYGGKREIDNDETILRRSYIPQDAHSWAKEYTSSIVDGYNIADYTPLSQPTSGNRHFFGNLTPNYSVNCATLANCTGLAPWLSVIKNSNLRVWEWASTERPVLAGNAGGSRTDYTVRVDVCKAPYINGCKLYPNGKYKPTGILHDYGESNAMLFGLITGSYDNNISGGRLRKVVSDFKNEVDQTNGRYTASASIVQSFDAIRIRDFNNGNTAGEYKNGFNSATRPMKSGEFKDWGNPIAEIMYEGIRYFAGKGVATPAYNSAGNTVDLEVGLKSATWDDPFSPTSAAKAPFCAKSNLLVISDVNVSYDSDELPGSNFGSIPGDIGLNVGVEATTISSNEPTALGKRFIGQSDGIYDSTPSPKTVTDLGRIRGIAPEEPTKQGSYYAASVAYHAKRTDLRTTLPGKQSVDTFVVALASPLPRIEAKLPNKKTITMVPFAKSVNGFGITNTKGAFQPTNQIVDFYVEKIANSGVADADPLVNGGRYFAKFRINFEDQEQGADHDMDAIVEYTVTANADSTLSVNLKPIYEAGSIQHRIGYIISGTTDDGVYLVVQDESDTTPYFLNTPPGKSPGYCDVTAMPVECNRLPYLGGGTGFNDSSRVFTTSNTSVATILKDPLWYAAKWGGFKDSNNNDKPDLVSEWDSKGDGVPDNYLLVQNPLKLKASLKKTLDEIVSRSSSGSSVSSNSTSISSTSRLYQSTFNTQRWSGNVVAYPVLANGIGSTAAWEAAAVGTMPLPSARKIFMRNSASATTVFSSYGALTSTDQTEFVNSDTVDYLRGVRTKELQNGGTLRDRENILGDIVHSSPYYDKDTNVVYVGANDGMLHALDGGTGVEKFAFIPRSSVSRMKNLANASYTHDFLVDGDVLVSPRLTQTNSKNYLFSLLGRGGKGLFSLDVTNPATFGTTNFLWEYTPQAPSTTGSPASDADLGYMLGRPIFALLNNGNTAVIAGNGYNSTSGKAVLHIFILKPDGTLDSVRKIDTGVAGDNGLASPTFVDVDNNGTADYVYAGDLKGNVWKFDLTGTLPSNWKVALSGAPLFVAKDGSGNVQPITAPMFTSVNDKIGDPNLGKRFVFFGTGSYFKSGDIADSQTQSWYGVADQNTTVASRSVLKNRTISQVATVSGRVSRTFSTATAGDMSGKSGWYIDWNNPSVGERVVTTSKVVKFAVPALLASSLYPVPPDPCVPGGLGYLNFVDPYTGAGLQLGIFDANNNNNFTDDKLGTEQIGSIELGIGIPSEPLTLNSPGGKVAIFVGGTGNVDAGGNGKPGPTTCPPGTLYCGSGLGGTTFKGRISWREIVKD